MGGAKLTRTWYVTQVRHGENGQWFDDRHLYGESDEERKAEVEAMRAEPELEGYEVRVVRRTEEVLDI